MSTTALHDPEDGCAGFGPTQKWATVWFFAILAIGSGLTLTFRNTDYYNYMTNNEYFDMQASRENRIAWATVPRDNIDERMHGDLVTARAKLAAETSATASATAPASASAPASAPGAAPSSEPAR